MRSWLQLTGILAATCLLAPTAFAGFNSGATCRLTWGTTFESQQTEVATPEGTDSQITLWVSAIGLRSFRGADIQLLVASAGSQAAGSQLPSAWQFQAGTGGSCPGGHGTVTGTKSFPGSAFSNVEGVAVAQNGMIYGSGSVSADIRNLWVIWFTAAGAVGAPCDALLRYGIAEFRLTVPGTKCPGVSAPVGLTPSLRVGYEHESYYGEPKVALLDGNNQVDAVPFEPGFDRAAANTSASAVRAGTRLMTWSQMKRAYIR